MPTLLCSWRHSAVVLDVKSELFEASAEVRGRYSKVLRFAPGQRGSPATYNPLSMIRSGPDGVVDARAIAEHLAPAETGDRDPFWNEAAKPLVAAAILHVIDVAPEEERNLAGVASALAQGEALGALMQASKHPDRHARAFIQEAAARVFLNSNERMIGSILGTVHSWLSAFTEPAMAEATANSSFTPSDLMCGDTPASLFITIAPPDLARTRPLLRVMLAQMVDALMHSEKTDRDGRAKLWKVCWLLDELPQIGKLGNLETVLPVARSMGHRFVLGVQGLSQLRQIYGNGTSIPNNCRLICMRQNAIQEAREISQLVGEAEETKVSRSRGWSWSPRQRSRSGGQSVSTAWRVVIQPAEVTRMSPDRMIIFGESKPILARRTPPNWWRHLVPEAAG
jgi:type IV secretion system protein VirD4